MLKKRILILLLISFIIVLFLVLLALKNAKNFQRNENLLLNKFYHLKKTNPRLAEEYLNILLQNPNNVRAQKEYYAWLLTSTIANYRAGATLEVVPEKVPTVAVNKPTPMKLTRYKFKSIPATRENLALKKAYFYLSQKDFPKAYQYFKLADDQKAMTNLAGLQLKALPWPYYSEFFFMPFHQSRFNLTVEPLIWRVGVEQKNKFNSKEYAFLRRTQDNRSESTGLISQLYEDDVQIIGLGGSINPITRFPLLAFVEVGAAYDLVYRQREPWRYDVRSGLMYFDNFGARPSYFNKLTFSDNYYSNWYGEAVYFSRYQNNVIGTLRTQQGIRFLQYKSTMLNLYVTGRVVEDTKRLFYNNFTEVGPGVSLVPSNRWNFELRYEWLQGFYLPAGAIHNPYATRYTNEYIQMLFYVRL